MFPQKLLKSPLMLVKCSQWFPILVRVSEAPCITSTVFVEFPYPLFNLHIYYNIFFLKNQERFFILNRISLTFWKISFLTFYKYYNIFFKKNQKSFSASLTGTLVWRPLTSTAPSAIPAKKTRPTYYGALPAELNPYVGRGWRARTSDIRLGRQK